MGSSEIHRDGEVSSPDHELRGANWQRAQWLLLGYLAFLLYLYSSSFLSMVSIWQRSDTFAHGFIIPIISLWLIYRALPRLKTECIEFSHLGVGAVLVGSIFWLIANLAQVLVIEQLSVVFMLVSGVVGIIGLRQSRIIAFPLLFLFLMVPMGEELIAPMMEFTATSTVWLIRLVDIPVYREGLYFSLPSGNWSVVEACSGVRYLIASFALGLLYAYLTYRTLYKRLLFVGFSIIVPVLANSLRAFLIVMIGHYSDMQYAVGVDHLIYGWVFFGLVIFLMFWIGSFFAEDEQNSASVIEEQETGKVQTGDSDRSAMEGYPSIASRVLIGVSLLVLALSQSIPDRLYSSSLSDSELSIASPDIEGLNVEFISPPWSWLPDTPHADLVDTAYYQWDGRTYGLYSRHFKKYKPGSELVNSLDQWVSRTDDSWRVVESGVEKITLKNQTVSTERVVVSNGVVKLQVWRWYGIGGNFISSRYLAKLYEFFALFDPSSRYSSRFYLATQVSLNEESDTHRTIFENLIPELSLRKSLLVEEHHSLATKTHSVDQ